MTDVHYSTGLKMQLKKYFQKIHAQTKNKYSRTYIILVALRVCLVFVPQSGYIHPDEFFQSVEVVAGIIATLVASFMLVHTQLK